MTINKKAVKDYVLSLNPELRVGKEFFETLDSIVKERVSKAVQRNRSLSKKTLGKDQLYM